MLKEIVATSPIAALKGAFPQWEVNAVMEIPSDGYVIFAANIGDVTLLTWKNSRNEDGTALYICKSVCW